MTTLALRENVTMARHPVMLRNVDDLIGFFTGVGLPLGDAYLACMESIRLVVGFVELQDSLYDRPPAHLDPADLEQLPPPWLRPATAAELPHLNRLGELEPAPPDALFEFALDILVDGIARSDLGGPRRSCTAPGARRRDLLPVSAWSVRPGRGGPGSPARPARPTRG